MRRYRRPTAHRRASGAVLAAVVAPATLALLVGVVAAGCGGSTGGPTHFSNPTYGISLTVDRRLTQWRTATVASGGAFEVSFVDTAGAVAGSRHLDTLTVSLVDTHLSPSGQQAAQVAALLRRLGAAMVAKLGADAQAGAVSDVSLNGLTGVVVPYGVTVAGRAVVGWLYLLTSGGRMYALTAGATVDRWNLDRPLFAHAIGSFRVN